MLYTGLTVVKVNEVKAQLLTEDFDLIIKARNHFRFLAEGYLFHPAYRNKSWDGYIHLLDVDGFINCGQVGELKEFARIHNIDLTLDPNFRDYTLDKTRFENWVGGLNIHSDGTPITPYDYQRDAAHWILEHRRGLIEAVTSAGKSMIIYLLIRMYELMSPDPDEKFVLIVPRTSLVNQMIGDFKDYSSHNGWNVDKLVGKINAGQNKKCDKKFTITTFQSLSNAKTKPPKEWFAQFKGVMVDEVHTAAAKSVISILESCVNAEYRFGCTGSFDESKTNEMTLRGLFGDVMKVISLRELIDSGKVASPNINVCILRHSEYDCKKARSSPTTEKNDKGKAVKKKMSYQEEISFINASPQRNRFVMRLAASLKGNAILMVNEVVHGQNLYNWLKQALPDRPIYLYTGQTSVAERDHIKAVTELQDDVIIVGSLGVISTGISIKKLKHLVMARPTKSRVKVIQSMGRILRKSKHSDYNEVTVWDLVDDMSVGKYENYVLQHGRERTRHYASQQVPIDMKIYNLDDQ